MYKDRILKLLRGSRDRFLSGEELADKLGISRTMVWKHIQSLEREGFGIEAVRSRGYRITSSPDILRLDDIKRGLKTAAIGRQIHLFPEIASTNTLAMEMASHGAVHGTVVLAEAQTAGKGRLGRKWISPRGNLHASVILRPEVPTQKAPLVTLMGAVAAASAIRTVCRLPALIKWPNDILVSGKKAGGLLTEMSAEPDRIRHIVLGIGLNVNNRPETLPAEIRPFATTLSHESGGPVDRTLLLQEILRDLERWYRTFLTDDAAVLKEWESHNATIGNRVSVSTAGGSFQGLARSIDSEGRLVVVDEEGSTRTVASGDVTILKKA